MQNNDQIDEVKSRNDIVDVISSYLTLKKAGSNFKANCPFHHEKTPSFMISPERQSFKCFGCNTGGDVITFVEKMEGLDFYNALKLLAEKVGIELKTSSVKFGDKEFTKDDKTKLFEINEWTKRVYHKILVDHPKAEKAREYLKNRGMDKKTIMEFEIGYAPNSWDFLVKFLASKKFTDKDGLSAGVLTQNERGKVFDRFRGRIIFPINNILGNTIAFTSRILEDDGKSAKYINSSESKIYTKGKTIYGLDKAKNDVKKADLAVLVEGNMDVIACHQAGFKNVVATSGTALTIDQLITISRYTSKIAFCFDTDDAGKAALKRAIRMSLQNNISTLVVCLSGFKDPDEAIKKDKSIFEKAVSQAKPSLEYLIDELLSQRQGSVFDKKAVAKEVLPLLKITASEIEKSYYIKYLADKLDIKEDSILDELKNVKEDSEFVKKEQPFSNKKQLLDVIDRIVGIIWTLPDVVKEESLNFDSIESSKKEYEIIIKMIIARDIKKDKIDKKSAQAFDQLSLLAMESVDQQDRDSVLAELLYLLKRQKNQQNESLRRDYAHKLKEAEKSGDKEALKKLLLEFQSLIK